jgi:nitroimidazol reductase NimA-like FMN-containing flavoprotein (pyridoxamine 5'-phosphate oxidase superfamily)
MTDSESELFPKTAQNTVKRVAKRAEYDRDTVYQVFDSAWICHIGFVGEFGPTVIPMFHVRVGDEIVLHGATSSRLMLALSGGAKVCISAAMVDGLVLARSLFHHSMNYRSAVAFGSGRAITDDAEKMNAFRALSDKVMHGRWDDARQPSPQEFKATAVVAVKMETASAKIRTGGPKDEEDDYGLPVWAGVVPLQETYGKPVPDEVLPPEITPPDYLLNFVASNH